MKRFVAFAVAVLGVLALQACSSSSSTPLPTTNEIQLIGTITGLSPSVVAPVPLSTAKATHDLDPSCPTTDQTNSFTTTPASYKVKLKKVTLLGSSSAGTADYDLQPDTTYADATTVDFTTTTTFVSSTTYPPAGTYDGFEIEVYFIEENIPMVVPDVNSANGESTFFTANYATRGYFSTVDNIEPRDVTIFADAGTGTTLEYWVGRENYDVVAVTAAHPATVLDLWSDPNFWCQNGEYVDGVGCTIGWRTPMTICTRATSTCDPAVQGTDFTFTMADGSSSLEIPLGASGTYTITFAFDVSNKFTFWGDVNYPNPSTESFGTFRVGYDCGYRIMFPNITVSITTPST